MNDIIAVYTGSPSSASAPQERSQQPMAWYERVSEIIEGILRAFSQASPTEAAGSGFGHSASRVTSSTLSALKGSHAATLAFGSSIAGKTPASPAEETNPSQDKNVVKKKRAPVESFDVLFPSCRERLPKDLGWLENKKKELNRGIDPFEKLDSAWKTETISVRDHFVTPLKELEKESKSPSIQAIKDCLLQHSPLFAKAYELASQPKVSEVPIDSISMSTAFYDPFSHQIKIAKEQDFYWKARDIVFETVNALQSVRFRKLCEFAEAGELGREEFTVLAEYLENDTLLWTDRIIGLDKTEKKNEYDFINNWKKLNTPQKYGPKDNYIHADHYRERWDKLCSAAYLKKHP